MYYLNKVVLHIHKNIQNYFLFFLFLGIFPFLALSFYTHPFYDDFKVFSYTKGLSFYGFFEYWYFGWTGAYTIITLWYYTNPLFYNSLDAFRWIPFIYILINILATFTFFSVLVKGFKLKLILSLSFTLLYLSQAPALNETLYWYVGATAYYLPVAFLIFFYALFIKFLSQKINFIIYTLLLIFSLAIVGTIPFLIVFHIALLAFLTLNTFYKFPRQQFYILILLLITVLMAWVNLGSMGNLERTQAVVQNLNAKGQTFEQNTLKLIILSTYYLLYNVANWLSSGILLLATFLYIPIALNIENHFKIKEKLILSNPFLFLFGTILMLVSFNIIINYLHAPAPRIWNIFFLLFLINWFVFIQLLVTYYIEKENFKLFLKVYEAKQILSIFKIFLIFLIFIPSQFNVHNAYYDLVFVVPLYDKFMQERYKSIRNAKKNGENEVTLPLLTERETSTIMFNDDIRKNHNYHLNNLYEQYFGIKKIKGK